MKNTRAKSIHFPCSKKIIRSLKIGDHLKLSGIIMTARDMAHKHMVEKQPPFLSSLLKNSAIYHCGPVVTKNKKKYHFLAAGPTTSIREEKYQETVIKNYQVRAVIGKGGMGDKTSLALQKYGSVYLHAVGGAASFLATSIIRVVDVFFMKEFGSPEAMWQIELSDFPALVTMDSHGNSLHKNIATKSQKILDNLWTSL